MKKLGLYIHVPFCIKKCNYCDFYSVKATDETLSHYIESVENLIKQWSFELYDYTVGTIYFGGGTPSILETKGLLRITDSILGNFKIAENPEITAEVNPITTENIDFRNLHNIGFNRISVGMQSSDDKELAALGRLHGISEVDSTINSIVKGGITNFSLDVMLGIPLQTSDSLNNTLEYCINSGASHISTYMLKIEKGTPFYNMQKEISFSDDDVQADFFEQTAHKLKSAGFRHYEISNFCRDDKISRHNMKYWELDDYLGIGPSAHSMIKGKRFYYPKDLNSFGSSDVIYESDAKSKEEFIMLSLRTDLGLNFKKYKNLFGKNISENVLKEARLLSKHGLINIDDNRISLTERGFLLSNTIITRLLSKEIL